MPDRNKDQTRQIMKSNGERRQIRMSYIFPLLCAILFIIMDLIGILKGINSHAAQYLMLDSAGKKTFDYLSCGLDLFISYVPSSICSMMIFAIMQQKIYGQTAGLSEEFIGITFLLSFFYLTIYVAFLLCAMSNIGKGIETVCSVAFCIYIWVKAVDKSIKTPNSPDTKRFSG